MKELGSKKRVKILVIDDSKTMQEVLANLLLTDPEIEIVGKASDAYEARELIKKTNPDVITLDIIMPKMDGITFLKNIMRLHPMPVVMISTLTEQGSAVALEALALGAVSYIPKPNKTQLLDTQYVKNLIQTVKEASLVTVQKRKLINESAPELSPLFFTSGNLKKVLVTIGGSTGGVEAFEYLFRQLPKIFPAILITQHISAEFSTAFATRLNKISKMEVKEANDNEEIHPGIIYLPPSNINLTVEQKNDQLFCRLVDDSDTKKHKPSVDVLFKSIAKLQNVNIIAIVLTGMGDDGALGAKAIHDAGGLVIAQDKASCVVFGMPKAAIEMRAVDKIVPLQDIPTVLFREIDNLLNK